MIPSFQPLIGSQFWEDAGEFVVLESVVRTFRGHRKVSIHILDSPTEDSDLDERLHGMRVRCRLGGVNGSDSKSPLRSRY